MATGTLHGVHPDRIVAKKVVLSGHPMKIINKQAIVRYMFFNRGEGTEIGLLSMKLVLDNRLPLESNRLVVTWLGSTQLGSSQSFSLWRRTLKLNSAVTQSRLWCPDASHYQTPGLYNQTQIQSFKSSNHWSEDWFGESETPSCSLVLLLTKRVTKRAKVLSLWTENFWWHFFFWGLNFHWLDRLNHLPN